jgi:hypothetical protein
MRRKSFIICLSVLLVTTLINIPANGDMTTTGNPMTVGWPTLNGAPPKAQTIHDPNVPSMDDWFEWPYYRCRVVYYPVNGGANCQTFSTDGNTDGFTLSRIAVRAAGPGSSNPDMNYPFTVHIFDVNANYGWVPGVYDDAGQYIPANARPYCGAVDLLSDPAFAADPCLMIYSTENADTLIYFDFDGIDKVDLEPGHTYAIEVWGPLGWTTAPPYIWGMIWNVCENTYPAGCGYQVAGTADNGNGPGAANLTNPRGMSLGGVDRDFVMAVYGDYADGNAFHPSPKKYQTHVSTTPTLTWHPGKWAKTHQVWFSTNFNQVAHRSSYANRGKITDPCWTPTSSLAFNTTYYWRVDEYNDTNTVPVPHPDTNYYWGEPCNPLGDTNDGKTIYRFTTISPYATNPVPSSAVVPQQAVFKPQSAWLKWTPGALVASTNGHQVYFGTSATAVSTANTSTPVTYRGEFTDPCYPLKNLYPDYSLTSGTAYYWRVDEVNTTMSTTWTGSVWNFKMPNPAFILLDDFAYSSQADLSKVWQSGYQNNGGSISASASAKVLTLDYNNSGSTFDNWSEAKLDFNNPAGVDLTLGGVFAPKVLAVQFDGQVDLNDIDPTYNKLYIGLEDTNGDNGFASLDSDPYAAQRQITIDSGNLATREFKVALTDPNFSAVDLTDVNRVYLGIGIRGLSGQVLTLYTGQLKFTNPRVYVRHCNPTYPQTSMVAGDLAGPLQGQLSGDHSKYVPPDCVVNLHDIYFLMDDWLYAEPNLVYDSNVDPGASNMTVWYKFDEGTGTLLADSSGNSRDATLNNVGPFTWAYAGHDGSNYCVNLEPGQHTWIECPNSVVAGNSTGQSFTFWLMHNDNFLQALVWSSVLVTHSTDPNGGDDQTMETQLPVPIQTGGAPPWLRWVDMRVSDETGLQHARPSLISSRWNHYALVYDTTNTKMLMYVNGKLIAGTTNSAFTTPWGPSDTGDGNANTVRIGQRGNSGGYTNTAGWGFWQGRIDDMRLYSKALSENEIQYLATDGTGKRNMQAVFIEPDDYSSSTVQLPGSSEQVKIVNFNDFAALANYWMNQQLWP